MFAPEPFTTPFGVAFILAARHLTKRREAAMNSRLRESVEFYLTHSKYFNNRADGESSWPGPVESHSLNTEHAIPGQVTGSRAPQANPDSSVRQNFHDVRRSTVHPTTDIQSRYPHYKTGDNSKFQPGRSDSPRGGERAIHHTVNMERLSTRYETGSRAEARSGRDRISGPLERVATYRSVNTKSLSQHYETGSVEHEKAKPHAINRTQLRQPYGPAVSYTNVRSALRSNNRHYELLSRGNVIGG
jgi:hypothetical protein